MVAADARSGLLGVFLCTSVVVVLGVALASSRPTSCSTTATS